MNNIILQSIRAVAVLAVALFAFVSDVFAAPMLLQPSVIEITGTSAVLRGYLQTNGERTLVRFEWSEASSVSAPSVVGVKDTFFDGFFTARLDGLTPGTTYSYRAIASSGGATTVSSVASFKTANQIGTVLAGSSPLGLGPVTSFAVTTKVVTQTNTSKIVAPVATTKQETTPVVTKEGFTNRNTAIVIGAGDGVFPTTLIGWVALMVSVLLVILIGRMIYESTEKRRKVLDEEDKDEEDEIE